MVRYKNVKEYFKILTQMILDKIEDQKYKKSMNNKTVWKIPGKNRTNISR